MSQLVRVGRRFAIGLIRWLLGRLPPRWVHVVLNEGAARLRIASGEFVTINSRPVRGGLGPHKATDRLLPSSDKIGIVIQGPLLAADNFTIETVRHYRTACPDCPVIVSTWDTEDPAALDQCRAQGAIVVCSPKPQIAGRFNVNYQIVSSRAGIEEAAKLGCQFVAKTRSDQRIYAIHTLYGLLGLIRSYPVINCSGLKHRLLGVSFGTTKFTPFHLSDFFILGATSDVRTFWSTKLDDCLKSRAELEKIHLQATAIPAYTEFAPERYLVTDFMRRIGQQAPDDVARWWQALGELFIIIDVNHLDMYWPKYWPHVERQEGVFLERYLATIQFAFSDWLQVAGQPVRPDPAFASVLERLPEQAPPQHVRESRPGSY